MKKNTKLGRGFYVPENSVMIDIETNGLDSEHSQILQIAAIRFDSNFEVVDEFEACLTRPDDRGYSEATVKWWKETNTELFDSFYKRARPYKDVLHEFCEFLKYKPYLWAWPVSFDTAFISSYATNYFPKILNKIHFSRFIDCRSWMTGSRGVLVSPEEQWELVNSKPPFEGEDHDALYDARYQIWCLKELSRIVAEREKETYLNFKEDL